MKTAIAIFALLYSTIAFSHTAKEEADYTIIFGACFDKDLISMKINDVPVFYEYKIGAQHNGGNLSLKQHTNKIDIFYNGQQRSKPPIDFNYYLYLEIKVNNQINKFKLDLRKGKVAIFQKCSAPFDDKQVKIKAEQINEPVLLM